MVTEMNLEQYRCGFCENKNFKRSGLSFILDLYGNEHPYYKDLKMFNRYKYESYIKGGIEIRIILSQN
jgi:hypothetical protein